MASVWCVVYVWCVSVMGLEGCGCAICAWCLCEDVCAVGSVVCVVVCLVCEGCVLWSVCGVCMV